MIHEEPLGAGARIGGVDGAFGCTSASTRLRALGACMLVACMASCVGDQAHQGDPEGSTVATADPIWLPIGALDLESRQGVEAAYMTGEVSRSLGTCDLSSRDGAMRIVIDDSARWREAARDSVLVEVRLSVLGEVAIRGSGYQSYSFRPESSVDTVMVIVVKDSSGSRSVLCETVSRYIPLRDVEDPGMYVNEAEFRRAVAGLRARLSR